MLPAALRLRCCVEWPSSPPTRGRGSACLFGATRNSRSSASLDRGIGKQEYRRLGIDFATAKNHVHNILEKLHVHRRGEAAARVRHRLPRRSALQADPCRR